MTCPSCGHDAADHIVAAGPQGTARVCQGAAPARESWISRARAIRNAGGKRAHIRLLIGSQPEHCNCKERP